MTVTLNFELPTKEALVKALETVQPGDILMRRDGSLDVFAYLDNDPAYPVAGEREVYTADGRFMNHPDEEERPLDIVGVFPRGTQFVLSLAPNAQSDN